MSRGMRMTALLIGLLLLAGCGGREAPVTGTSFLMDTIVEYKLYGKNAQAARDAIDHHIFQCAQRGAVRRDGAG